MTKTIPIETAKRKDVVNMLWYVIQMIAKKKTRVGVILRVVSSMTGIIKIVGGKAMVISIGETGRMVKEMAMVKWPIAMVIPIGVAGRMMKEMAMGN
jgi:hypothetical protein